MDDLARNILAFENRRYVHAGSKEVAIHGELGISATAYYLRLNQLLDDPEAAVADPMLVHRLRRGRDRQRRMRAARAG